jgi:hypothetical protein
LSADGPRVCAPSTTRSAFKSHGRFVFIKALYPGGDSAAFSSTTNPCSAKYSARFLKLRLWGRADAKADAPNGGLIRLPIYRTLDSRLWRWTKIDHTRTRYHTLFFKFPFVYFDYSVVKLRLARIEQLCLKHISTQLKHDRNTTRTQSRHNDFGLKHNKHKETQ